MKRVFSLADAVKNRNKMVDTAMNDNEEVTGMYEEVQQTSWRITFTTLKIMTLQITCRDMVSIIWSSEI